MSTTVRKTSKTKGKVCPLCGKDKKDWFWPSDSIYSVGNHPRCGCEVYLEGNFSEACELFYIDRGMKCASNAKSMSELLADNRIEFVGENEEEDVV